MLSLSNKTIVRTLVFVRDENARAKVREILSGLTRTTLHPLLADRPLAFNFIFTGSTTELASETIDALYGSGHAQPVVIMSDALLDGGNISSLAETIHGAYFMNRQLCAFVALGEKTVSQRVFSGSVAFSELSEQTISQALAAAAARLILLGNVHATSSAAPRQSISYQAVRSLAELTESFRLRHSVYQVLGYLDPLVGKSRSGLDIDFYDGMALHFVARDENTGELAGTIRLIIPHQPWGLIRSTAGSLKEVFTSQQEWFRQTIPRLHEPALRKRLRDATPSPLPMLLNTKIAEQWLPLVGQCLKGVELSRLVIHPKYQGTGVSRALVHLALATALELEKRLVFAECLSAHVPMYFKHGFQEMQNRSSSIAPSGNFHFTPESLFADLAQGGRLAQIAKCDSALFKLANPSLKEEQVVLHLSQGVAG